MLAFASTPIRAQDSENSEQVLTLYKSGIIELREVPTRISVGNPGIADIVTLGGNQVYILAKALGSTNVVFWNRQGRIFATVDIEVTHDLASLRKKLHRMLPDDSIKVYSAQENLVLEGEMRSIAGVNAALKIAESYLPECISSSSTATGVQGDEGKSNAESCEKAEVINLMSVTGSQQIMLEVKVAEMARTFRRSLDTDLTFLDFGGSDRFGGVNGGAAWPNVLVEGDEVPWVPAGVPNGLQPIIGPVQDVFQPNVPSISDKGLFFSDISGTDIFTAAIEISRSKGLAKVLAEPNLTTRNGQQAEFISGGEFPVPVPGDGSTSIEYKEYGVSVGFLPIILDDSRISLDVDITVSELDDNFVNVGSSGTNSVFVIPSLTKRGVSSTIELSNGQTIGIAGLIQDNVSEVISKLPGLGDVPILGALFRSQQYLSGQTELVIFVTAHFAKPIDPDKIKLPTDSFVPPSDIDFYLLGRLEGISDPKPVTHRKDLEGGFDGVTFGHDL